MKELNLSYVFDYIDNKEKINCFNVRGDLNFWHWFLSAFNLMENENFINGNNLKNNFKINFNEKIEEQEVEYNKILKFYESTDYKISIDLFNYYQNIKEEGIDISLLNIEKKEDLKKIKDEKIKKIGKTLFYLKSVNKKTISEDLRINNTDWIKEYVEKIDFYFGNYKNKNNEYLFKISYD